MTPASWIRGENIVTSIWYRLGAEYDTGAVYPHGRSALCALAIGCLGASDRGV